MIVPCCCYRTKSFEIRRKPVALVFLRAAAAKGTERYRIEENESIFSIEKETHTSRFMSERHVPRIDRNGKQSGGKNVTAGNSLFRDRYRGTFCAGARARLPRARGHVTTRGCWCHFADSHVCTHYAHPYVAGVLARCMHSA